MTQSNKTLHLIIDGPDKVGKSTVCQLLSRRLGIRVLKLDKMHKFHKTAPEEVSEVFNDTLLNFSDISFILDRGYPSSLVYSSIYKRTYNLDYLDLFKEILKPKVFILYRSKPRAQDEIIPGSDYDKILKEYLSRAKRNRWTLIDVKDYSPDQLCSLILKKL